MLKSNLVNQQVDSQWKSLEISKNYFFKLTFRRFFLPFFGFGDMVFMCQPWFLPVNMKQLSQVLMSHYTGAVCTAASGEAGGQKRGKKWEPVISQPLGRGPGTLSRSCNHFLANGLEIISINQKLNSLGI